MTESPPLDREPRVVAAAIHAAGRLVAAQLGKSARLDPIADPAAAAAAVHAVAELILARVRHPGGGPARQAGTGA